MPDEPARRKPGRPALRDGDPSVPLHVRIPGREYRQLVRLADAHRTTTAAIVRVSVRKLIRGTDGGPE